MPDEAREVVFPDGIQIQIAQVDDREKHKSSEKKKVEVRDRKAIDLQEKSDAEGIQEPESNVIKRQAAATKTLTEGENLLEE